MSIEKVRAHLSRFGVAHKIQEFPVSSATVALAAQALGCQPERIAKSLAFRVGGRTILVVTAGDAKVDNAKYKKAFLTKATMLTPEETQTRVGHTVGGVCPFALRDGVEVYLDESLRRFSTVFPACGSSNSAIELTIPQLEECSGGIGWLDVCKGWQETESSAQPQTATAQG